MSWGYAGLSRHLGHDRPLYGLQTSALTRPGSLPTSMDEIAGHYLREIRGVQPHGPYHLLGWSFGGVVAHEIAVRLEQEGEEVRFLGLMDAYPVAGGPRTSVSYEEVLGMMLDAPEPPRVSDGRRGLLDRDAVVERLRRDDQVLAGFEESDVAALVDAAVNHVLIMSAFTPRLFQGDAVLFRAAREKAAHAPEVDLWSPHISGHLKVHDIDSTHMGMTGPKPLSEIGRTIAQQIEPGKSPA